MMKVLAKRGLILAPLAFIACMEGNAPMDPSQAKPEVRNASDMIRTHVEEAFPGRTGEWKEGYYRGDRIAYQVIDGRNVLDGDIVLDDSDITSSPALPKGEGAATSVASAR